MRSVLAAVIFLAIVGLAFTKMMGVLSTTQSNLQKTMGVYDAR